MLKNKLSKLQGVDVKLAITIVILAALAAIFIAIADETMEGETLRFDNAVLLALRQSANPNLPIGPSWLLTSMLDISALGGFSITVIIIVAICGFFLLVRKFRSVLYLLVSVGGGALVMVLLKDFFSRPRPSVVPHLQQISEPSFPSGHSMVAAIVYLTLAAMLAKSTTSYKLKAYYALVAISLTALIGISRVYLGVHYPTDVAAGWLAGAVWAATTYLIGDWLESRGKIEPEDRC